jgi:hypothetical protein
MIDFPVIKFSTDGRCVRCGSHRDGSYHRVRPYAFQRCIRRHYLLWSPDIGVRVYPLPCGCCLWVHSTGHRYVTSLPY